MKRLLIYLFSLFCLQSYSQDNVFQLSTANPLLSISSLIDSALLYSPLLKLKAIDIEIMRQQYKAGNKAWMDYLFIEGATNYGLYDQVVISNQTTGELETSGSISKNEQIRYYGGIGLKLPLSAITTHANTRNGNRLKIEKANQDLLDAQNNVRLIVIEEYYKLIYLEESMQTFIAIYNTLEISYLKAEQDLASGMIKLNDFGLLASTYGKAKDDYSKAKYNYYAQYHKMQVIVGTNINK